MRVEVFVSGPSIGHSYCLEVVRQVGRYYYYCKAVGPFDNFNLCAVGKW